MVLGPPSWFDGGVTRWPADERSRAGIAEDEFGPVLEQARRGAPSALDALVRSVDRQLVGFLRARGADDPEGSANEVLVRVCRAIASFEGNQAQFRGWVFSIARNLVIDEHRATLRRIDARPEAPSDLVHRAGAYQAHDGIEQREQAEALLDGLTDDQREVMLLRVVAGLPVEEVARVLDRRPGAVRALQHRALERLRAQVVAKGA